MKITPIRSTSGGGELVKIKLVRQALFIEAYVSISATDSLVQKELIRTLPTIKIVDDEIIFVR